MYKSPEISDGIIGKATDDVIVMLGAPDYKSSNELCHNTKPGYIELAVKNNIVTGIEYRQPLD